MKKTCFFCITACCILISASGCTLSDSDSKDSICSSQNNRIETDKSDSVSGKNLSDLPQSSNNSFSQKKSSAQIQTAVGYVLSRDEHTIYVDLQNTDGRLYPGEGEDRKVAFDISDARQVLTGQAESNFAGSDFVRSGIQATIEYYVDNGKKIATTITSDGDEREPYSPVAIGTVTAVSDAQISLSVSQGENAGRQMTFLLTHCEPITDLLSVNSQAAVAYYTDENVNYAVYAECIS